MLDNMQAAAEFGTEVYDETLGRIGVRGEDVKGEDLM